MVTKISTIDVFEIFLWKMTTASLLLKKKFFCQDEWFGFIIIERAERARLRQERQWIMMNGGDVPEEILQSLEKTDDGEESEENEEKKLDDLDK